MDEKNALGTDIRTLNPNQLRGIIGILSDPESVDQNLKYFEFDIENLPVKKLRELEQYVRNSLKQQEASISNSNTLNESEKIARLKTDLSMNTKLAKGREVKKVESKSSSFVESSGIII